MNARANAVLRDEVFDDAFTERGFDQRVDYEIHEFIGDSILHKFVAVYFASRYPEIRNSRNVGTLFIMRAKYASKIHLASVSRWLGFQRCIRRAPVEFETRVDISVLNAESIPATDSQMEDVFESFVGALYDACERRIGKHSGDAICHRFLHGVYDDYATTQGDYETTTVALVDPITELKEIVDAARGVVIKFDAIHSRGYSVYASCIGEGYEDLLLGSAKETGQRGKRACCEYALKIHGGRAARENIVKKIENYFHENK